jgi:leucyl-tRNA synthetase
MPRYTPADIEPKWQKYWAENDTFRTPEIPGVGGKLYVLDMFPYPSGEGLHVGHPEGYTATDIVCRFQRMRGKSVLHPMGFDAFGLPAEEHAIKTNTHPRVKTEENVARFTEQLKSLGFSYDWNRCISTTDVAYFKWTQWIFLTIFDTWYDAAANRGRPISELPIPPQLAAQGDDAVRRYQDEHRLAYQSNALVNWCPELGTVLANEEVIDGKSERGGHPVVRMPLRQWMLRITAYADRLANDLEQVDWSEGIKKLQRDWIGRSTGAEVDFFIGVPGSGAGERRSGGARENKGETSISPAPQLPSSPAASFEIWKQVRKKDGYPRKATDDVLRIYTTRPDTLFGATYMVIAPEHPFVARLTTEGQKSAVQEYCAKAASKSDMERGDDTKKKTGVFTGSSAINPVNGESIPIWIADYVLISYGTGAIMAVPAHDERDYEFATTFSLPVVEVVQEQGSGGAGEQRSKSNPPDSPAPPLLRSPALFTGDGTAINSGPYNGLTTPKFKTEIIADLASSGVGREAVNYKLRDWLFSRQRFWGEPFPILHELDADGRDTGLLRAVDAKDLPVDLPHLDDFKPHGRPEPPLAKAPPEWLYPTIDGKRYRRETNTMPQWAGSCWYYLRFIDPTNADYFVCPVKEKIWMPVDLYVGGAEHAVLHLLYARFWHKVLYDRGYVSTVEPFKKLVNQGMILGENGEKMSKSRGNVINPDQVIRDYGADSLRLYEMFMGPLEATKPWSMQGVSGVRGFLDRAWRLFVDDKAERVELSESVKASPPLDEQQRVIHKTIQAVTRDLETMSFNTGIARLMEFVNYFTKQPWRPREGLEKFVLLLAPYAPHLAEELWSLLGHNQSLTYEPWPEFEERWTKDSEIEIPVQILGKLRGKVVVPADADQAAIETAAKNDPKIAELLAGKTIVKTIVVAGKLVNFVVK